MRSWPRARSRIATASVAALAAAALIASGCGDGEGEPGAEPLGPQLGGSVAQLAQCRHWRGGTEAEKHATIADIREQVSRPDGGVEAPALSDGEAMELFDGACAEEFADGFRLYVLYARAAGFAPLLREIEQ